MPEDDGSKPSAATSLRLPPTFVSDHCVRTLASQGAMTLGEVTRHWRVSGDVAAQILDSARQAGLIETEGTRSGLETGQRWRLSGIGQARIEGARARTWYAGAMPVSLQEFASSFAATDLTALRSDALMSALESFHLEPGIVAECGQAIAARAPLLLGGCADDEQAALADALGSALEGSVKLPLAIYAAGAIVRVVDPRHHRAIRTAASEGEGALRSREQHAPWLQIAPPSLRLTGGLILSDVLPPFDADARFYLAPAPMVASGGVLTVCNAANSEPEALERLARHWLVPASGGTGMLLLQTGERVEIPWAAAVVIFASPDQVSQPLTSAVAYKVDAALLRGEALRGFLGARLPQASPFTPSAIDGVASNIENAGTADRQSVAALARYLRDRAAYEGAAFALTNDVVTAAMAFAGTPQSQLRRVA